jgi:hypothetical protein
MQRARNFDLSLINNPLSNITVDINTADKGLRKQAFRAAFELGWVREKEQEQYLQKIDDHNLTSHTYKEDLANQILARIQSQHFKVLKNLLLTIKQIK